MEHKYRHENSPLLTKSEKFSVRIVKMVQYLDDKKLGYKPNLTQILRSGTSVAANIAESQFAQTPADFITKLHISLKEANETKRWLNLFYATEVLTEVQYESIISDLGEIIALLIASLNTSKKKQEKVN